MSYYDKKIIKGSYKKEDYCKREDHCKKEDHCEKHDWRCEEEEEVVGVVTSTSLATLTIGVGSPPTPLPLTTPILVTEGVKIAPTGGLIVEEDGEYLVSFSAGLLAPLTTGTISIYADSKFLGNAGPLAALGLANFAKIVRLRKGDTVQAVFNGTLTLTILSQATLTVAKLHD